jgi:preprotein translocase subunit SecE
MTKTKVIPKQPEKKPAFSFFRELFAELKKVVWPTRSETAYLTMMVLIVAGTVGAVLGALDYGFSVLVEQLFFD